MLYGEMHHNNKLIGRAMLGVHDDPKMLEIDKIWVDKNHRRAGHANRMLNEAKSKTGIKTLWAPHVTEEGEKLMDSQNRKAKGGSVSRGTVKEKVTISPNMDVMQYELINKKAK